MDGTGPQQPLSDSQLDRELESALGVEPSPEFLARVRTRVAAEPESAPWRLAIRRWSFESLAGVAVAGIVLAVVVPNLMTSAKRLEPAATVARHVDGPIRQAVEQLPPAPLERVIVPVSRYLAPGTRPVGADVPTSAEATVGKHAGLSAESDALHTLPLRLSKPLFSEDERRALMQLLVAVDEGRLPPVVPEAAPAAAAQPDAQTALHIEPLVIDPLPMLARVQKEGERQW